MKKFRRKIFFSGISEANQANFRGPRTFCLLFGPSKSRPCRRQRIKT
jgi:hypothetical protein